LVAKVNLQYQSILNPGAKNFMNNWKQILALISILLLNLPMVSSPINDRYSSDSERYGILNQRQAIGKEYFSLLPGVQYRSTNLIVNAPNGAKLRMPDEEKDETRIFLDIKSRDFHFGEVWGLYFLIQNYDFDLTKQTINKSYGGYYATGTSIYGSNNRVVNLGTELNGNIKSFIPVFYIGDREKEIFRIGLGFGPSLVRFHGNPDFYNGWSAELPLLGLKDSGSLNEKIDRMGDFALLRNGKWESDPWNALLLSNLSATGSLELFGLYQYSKGNLDISKLNLYSLYLISQLTDGNLNPLQIIALASLGRSDIKLKEKYVSSFYFCFEIPFYDLTFRLGYGGPIYYQEDYRVRFHNVDLSIYLPIDI
jgi:hypothetical protein